MVFEIDMYFQRPPVFTVRVKADSEIAAIEIAKDEAKRGGFGTPKKLTITEEAICA